MKSYQSLIRRVSRMGEFKPAARAGLPSTVALFGESLHHDMREGFPLLTVRHMSPRGVLGELAAFLAGTDKLKDFEDLGCNYWRADAERWKPGQGLVGRTYGVQWRHWQSWDPTKMAPQFTDQLANLVDRLALDPFSRRHLLTTWNPGELNQVCLPPCHVLAQFSATLDRMLDCQVYMRSVDLMLGLPSDLILYGMLLLLVARKVGYAPRKLIFAFGDAHIYENHKDGMEKILDRLPASLPTCSLNHESLFSFSPDGVQFENYTPHDPIKFRLNAGS